MQLVFVWNAELHVSLLKITLVPFRRKNQRNELEWSALAIIHFLKISIQF